MRHTASGFHIITKPTLLTACSSTANTFMSRRVLCCVVGETRGAGGSNRGVGNLDKTS